VLGIVMPVNMVLAQSPRAAVTLGSITAYPDGFEFDYLIRSTSEELGQSLAEQLHRRHAGADLPDDLFRVGVEFADGTRVTSIGSERAFGRTDTGGPAMVPRGGGGNFLRWEGNWWVTPLPPAGRLELVCEWPAAGILLTRAELDATAIRDAASRSVTLWEDDNAQGTPSGGSVGMQQITFTKSPPKEPE
jgi:hypothetical protein